jgi:uncharacterized protein YdhG (YjbR/CyaY superfamily)
MAELKTKPTAVSVEAFLDKIDNEEKRADAYTLLELMKQITGEKPRMWGPSMIGFGAYHYKYTSGHEGDIFLAGFAPRKTALTIYAMAGADRLGAKLKKLGKYKASKGCVYVKKLADIDLGVLREIIQANIAALEQIHGANAKAAAMKKTRKKK